MTTILAFSSFAKNASTSDYQELEWIALMPPDDLQALLNPPEHLLDIQDGSALDSVDALVKQEFEDEKSKRFQQALVSTEVVETYKDKAIRIPGFVVPLESNEAQRVIEFFIVPYFGACLHMPPPPPNQIIHVKHEEGIELESIQDAFWFEGTLSIETVENDLGTSAYQLSLDNLLPFRG
ncbi:DUF3299 domain-containing protein [Agaribacter flavus]|uniref:DUF3299 domain-containing protein n=1 Tax=Agaribacter flavus TaxID=1902781 RepID=A0ABV7FPQ6_9ALTE